MKSGNDKEIKQRQINSYLKYSGLAFQLAAVVLLGWLAGGWLDNLLGFDVPYITIGLIITLFSVYLYRLYVDLTGK